MTTKQLIAKWVGVVLLAQVPVAALAASPKPGSEQASAALAFNPFTKTTTASAGGPLLFAANSASVAAPSLVTAADSPTGPLPGTSIFVSDSAVQEPTSGTTAMVFTLTLSQKSPVPIKVNYSTSNNTATAGSDYVQASGTVTFPANTKTAVVAVSIKADAAAEATETFYLNLSNPNPSVVTIANSGKRATGTIFDRPQSNLPKLTIAAGSGGTRIVEGNTGTRPVNLKVFLSDSPAQQVTYTFKTVDGTATVKDNEYIPVNRSATFAKNTNSLIHGWTVQIVGDTKKGKDETFSCVVSNPVNATLGSPSSITVTIVQDDF